MKLGDIYRKVVEWGIKNDPRGEEEVKAELEERRKEYSDLKGIKRELCDLEQLTNPYADTRILHGGMETEVRRVMVGIDIEGPELLLADSLRNKGKGVDLVIAHHPEGHALARLADVMGMQSAILAKYGVPINIAEDIMNGRIKEIDRRVLPGNHTRSVDIARILDIPFMCVHTPADNHVTTYLQKLFDEKKPRKVKDIIDLLYEHAEYRFSGRNGSPVTVFVGNEDRSAGKVFVDMTGGTEGSLQALEKLALSGVGTIVGMHMTEEHRKEAERHHLNVVIAGHISSDSLGLNLVLDKMMSEEKLDILEVSGFVRVDRSKMNESQKEESLMKKGGAGSRGSASRRHR